MHARTTALAAVAILATLTGCGSDTEPETAPAKTAETTASETPSESPEQPETGAPVEETPEPSPKSTKAGKYEQTWKTPYSTTTCGAYLNEMNNHERWVTAADMLTGARKTDGGSDLPADSEISRFQKDMSTACEGSADVKITEVGAALYLMDPSYKP